MRSFTDVHHALAARDVEHEIIHLPSSSRTAHLPADAPVVPISTVVKSLLFVADGRPVLALVSGDAVVDTGALTRELGVRTVTLAHGREVRRLKERRSRDRWAAARHASNRDTSLRSGERR